MQVFQKYIIGVAITAIPYLSQAQYIENKALTDFGKQMILAPMAEQRFSANQNFIKELSKELAKPNSFQNPYDSLTMVSKLYAPDNRFRILTWELQKDDNYYRQYGVIQMNTKGKTQIYPLFDFSEFTMRPQDSVRDAQHWIGAIYYKIIQNEYKGEQYYTLLGLDDNDFLSTKKWIDILHFKKNGEPEFGGNYFDYTYDTIKLPMPASRFAYEFKKDAKARMNYDEDLKTIVFEHLTSTENKPWDRMTLIPDGDYEGFKWENGKWKHISKLFNQQLQDGQAPLPNPLDD